MEMIKKIVNILVMVYLVLALLLYLDILNIGQQTNPGFYTNFFLAGGLLLLLELIVENIYIMAVKRQHLPYQNKINELKASLYDQKQETQDLIKKHHEELAVARATSHVPPQAPYPQEITSRPVLTPIDPNIIMTPAPLTSKPVDPADYPTKNTDSDTYREPNR